jgi:hypothetical protein
MSGSILFLASFQTIVKSKYLIIALTVSKHGKDKDLKCPFDNYWSPHINISKIEMGFSTNSSWSYSESNDQIFWFDNCLKTCQK